MRSLLLDDVEQMPLPLVTLLIPARNEAADIGASLEAVCAQDYPHDRIEVLVVDGGSADATATVARETLAECGFARIEVVPNPAGSTPSNLNAGLAAASGAVLCRVDARSIIPPHYVRRCVEVLETRPEVRVVGGSQVARARDDSATAVGIARALNNRYGMGLARYRRGAPSGPTDTVYLGAFRSEELRAAGGWDERFATNQDFELNRRMGRDGMVWFDASLEVEYLPRRTVGELFRQYRRFGQWKVRYWRLTGDRPQPRQLALIGVGPLGIVAVWLLGRSALRRPGAAAAVASGGLVAAVVVETQGATRPCGRPKAHALAVVALAATSSGWSMGVWGVLLRFHRG